MKTVLMVAFHFPPFAGSSGVQRTLRFVQHLPAFGWQPLVLTAHPRAYEARSDDLLADVAPSVHVERAFALDTARHLAVAGRYPGALARPDRWMTWQLDAVTRGARMIERFRPSVIWSTYPIATAHVIASRLQRRSGLPWIADFRDPMAQDGYPADPATWRSFKAIEQDALRRARFSVFCTPGAATMYRDRYPETARDRVRVIENGFDEETYLGLSRERSGAPLQAGRLTLLHSGVVYSSERDPTHLLAALGRIKQDDPAMANRLLLRFRASGNDALLGQLAGLHGVADMVQLAPALPHRQAIEEMTRADGLVVMQAANCNQQIPAKLYEYLRAGRPVLGLTDPLGDTAGALRAAGLGEPVPLDDPQAIATALKCFMASIEHGTALLPAPDAVASCTRVARTRQLAELLSQA